MKIVRTLLVIMLCVAWDLRGEDPFSFETNSNQDPLGLTGENSSSLFSSDAGSNPLGSDPIQTGTSSAIIDAFSSIDSFNSEASVAPAVKSEEPSVFDSSIIREGAGISSPELGQRLWKIDMEKPSMSSFESERSKKEDLTLFTEPKKEPLKINPLWQEDKSPSKQESSDMPWGWSLGPQAPKEQSKKGFLDW